MENRILIYYPRALVGNGGPTVAMWSWVRALKAAGQEVKIICDADAVAHQPLALPDVPVIPLKHKLQGLWRYPLGIGNYLTLDTVLILHSAFLAGNLLVALVAARIGSKVIFTPHGAYDNNARQRNFFLKRIWLSLESRVVEKALAVHVFVDTEVASIREVTPTVPIIVTPTPMELPMGYSWLGGGGYIAWFGRYDVEHKGLDLLIEAYRLVPENIRLPIRLHGRDSKNTRTEVAIMVEQAGLSNVISVGGPIEGQEKFDFLGSAEFFVMPSRWESFSIALLEVLALNVPSIISEAMPISRQLSDEHACIVSSIDPRKLAETLKCILKDKDKIKNNYFPQRFVQQHLTYEVIGKKFISEVEELLKKVR